MSRAVVLVLALAAAVRAEPYAFNQIDEIVARVDVCMQPVPSPSSFSVPGMECSMEARLDLHGAVTKESLADSVTACLRQSAVDAAVVATAQKCLSRSLAKPVKPALKEADYSSKQLEEIRSRIASCMTKIPANPASNCRNEAADKAQAGYPKESLVDYFIAPCMQQSGISKLRAFMAKRCIAKALKKPLA